MALRIVSGVSGGIVINLSRIVSERARHHQQPRQAQFKNLDSISTSTTASDFTQRQTRLLTSCLNFLDKKSSNRRCSPMHPRLRRRKRSVPLNDTHHHANKEAGGLCTKPRRRWTHGTPLRFSTGPSPAPSANPRNPCSPAP